MKYHKFPPNFEVQLALNYHCVVKSSAKAEYFKIFIIPILFKLPVRIPDNLPCT